MSDTLPDDTWVNSFLSSPPRPLLASLQRRLQASTTHINAMAEIYKQRAAIEAQYADSLARLAKSAQTGGLLGKGGVEWDKLGGEAKLWDSVIIEISEVSRAPACIWAFVTGIDFFGSFHLLSTHRNRLRAAHPRFTEQDRSMASNQ